MTNTECEALSPPHRRMVTWCMLLLYLLPASAAAAPYLRAADLVDSPKAAVLPHGIFAAGLGVTLVHTDGFSRQETQTQLDFGVLERLALGITHVDLGDDDFLQIQARLILFHEVQARPAVAIGLEGIGEEAPEGLTDRYRTYSPYLVLSKRFTLPVTQQFDLIAGWGNRRYRPKHASFDWLQGGFLGLQKAWHPSGLRGTLTATFDLNVRGPHLGLGYQMSSGFGLQTALTAIGQERAQYWLGITWGNGSTQSQIASMKGLVRAMARLIQQEGGESENAEE